jgi:hypothetical protein
MLRRIGYGLGLLFVLACIAAYPLTWGRWAGLYWATKRSGLTGVGIEGGTLALSSTWHEGEGYPSRGGWEQLIERRSSVPHGLLWRVGAKRSTWTKGGVVFFPVWMPALAASLFMAWRWRRRTRRRGAGFPLEKLPVNGGSR